MTGKDKHIIITYCRDRSKLIKQIIKAMEEFIEFMQEEK